MKCIVVIDNRATNSEGRMLWLVLLSGAVLVALLWATAASGATAYYSFTGVGVETQSFLFDVESNLNSPDPFSMRTWHYHGGMNVAGEIIAGGGINPILRLFTGEKTLIAVDDDIDRSGADPNYDAELTWGSAAYRPTEVPLPNPLRRGSYRLELASLGSVGDGHWAIDLVSDATKFTLTGIGYENPVISWLVVGSDDPNFPAHLELSSGSNISRLIIGNTGGATADLSGSHGFAGVDIGFDPGSVGTLTLFDAGYVEAYSFGTPIGYFGEGHLTVREASEFHCDYGMVLGSEVGSVGNLTITGTNSQVDPKSITIGQRGTGFLRVEDHGKLNTSAGIFGTAIDTVAAMGGSSGTIDVDGNDSLWSSGTLYVGYGGQGIIHVINGGKIDTSGDAYIARTASAAASSVTVSGMSPQLTKATWDISNDLYIAGDQTGPSSAPFSKLAINPGGWVDVAGTTTVWSGGGSLELLGGEMETGALVVKPGATFTHTDGTLTVSGGTFDPGTTPYEIDGADALDLPVVKLANQATASIWTSSGSFNVGDDRRGRLEILSGSEVDLPHTSYPGLGVHIGQWSGGDGEVLVDGQGSQLTTPEGLYVGVQGRGVLQISGGGLVHVSSSQNIGDSSGSVGLVEVSGKDQNGTPSTLIAPGLVVGYEGHGTMSISGGALANTWLGARIAAHPAASGSSATVMDAGTLWDITGPLFVGGDYTNVGGTGALTIANGGQVTAESVKVWQPGTIELNNGGINSGGLELAGGTLRGDGDVSILSGQLTNAGIMAPGLSAGVLNINGDYVQDAAGTLDIEISGPALYQIDRLQVSGNATLGGLLDVSLIVPAGGSDVFMPSAGQTYAILTAASLGGTEFATESLPDLIGGLYFDVLYSRDTVTLAVLGVVGDYNLNGVVDAADYTVWRDTLGSTTDLRANGDDTGASAGVIDGADYLAWKTHFGIAAGSGAGAIPATSAVVEAAIPEPATGRLLLTLAAILAMANARRCWVVRFLVVAACWAALWNAPQGADAALTGHCYNGWSIVDGLIDFIAAANVADREDPNLDYWDGSPYHTWRIVPGSNSNFGVEWVGFVRVDLPGQYGFGTISDDGSQVWIDDALIVDNSELQWYDWEDNISEGDTPGASFPPLMLAAGFHSIRVRWYEQYSFSGIELWWLTPGAGTSDIPYYGENFHGINPTYNPNTNWAIVPASHLFTAIPALVGDYNSNGVVDAADYTVWRDTLGSITDLRANGDDTGASAGLIDQADFAIWKSHFGATASGSGAGASSLAATNSARAGVPEPATSWILLFALGCQGIARHMQFARHIID